MPCEGCSNKSVVKINGLQQISLYPRRLIHRSSAQVQRSCTQNIKAFVERQRNKLVSAATVRYCAVGFMICIMHFILMY